MGRDYYCILMHFHAKTFGSVQLKFSLIFFMVHIQICFQKLNSAARFSFVLTLFDKKNGENEQFGIDLSL